MSPTQSTALIDFSPQRKLRLAYFVTHPIQYQAPLLRRIAQERDIDLKVFFGSDLSVRGYVDQGFGVQVKWDIPLLEGYNSEFLPTLTPRARGGTLGPAGPLNYGVKEKLREGQFDAVWVHGYNYLTNLHAIRAADSLGVPVLLRAESTLHDRTRSKAKLAIKKVFFNWLKPRIAAVLSIGNENEAYWKHNLGEEVPRFPCYYAVDNGFFQRACAAASETREEFRASLGLDAGRPVILFAAKLIARKRCADLLKAFLKLSEDDGPRPYLLIVGDGGQRALLESHARLAHIGDVRFLGFRNQSELPRFYDLCDVFVLASVNEPWGLAINEVMNAGRPVVVSDQVGCHKNLVEDGVNGAVVEAGDVDALTNSLRSFLESPAAMQSMGQASRRMIQHYNFEQNVSGLRQALHAVVPGFPALT